MPPVSNVIDAEVFCIACGYDLRGLTLDASCPECGLAVARSRVDDHLHRAEPAWLERIMTGQRFVSIGITVFMVTAYFGGTLLLLLASVGRSARVVAAVVGSLTVAGVVCVVFGLYWLTTLEPREATRERGVSARRRVRAGMAVALASVVAMVSCRAISTTPPWWFAAWAAGVVGAIAFAMTLVAFLNVQTRLAERLPEPELAAKIKGSVSFFGWGIYPCIAVWGLQSLAGRLGPGWIAGGVRGANRLDTFLNLASCLSLVLLMVVLFQFIGILIRVVAVKRGLDRVRRNLARGRKRQAR